MEEQSDNHNSQEKEKEIDKAVAIATAKLQFYYKLLVTGCIILLSVTAAYYFINYIDRIPSTPSALTEDLIEKRNNLTQRIEGNNFDTDRFDHELFLVQEKITQIENIRYDSTKLQNMPNEFVKITQLKKNIILDATIDTLYLGYYGNYSAINFEINDYCVKNLNALRTSLYPDFKKFQEKSVADLKKVLLDITSQKAKLKVSNDSIRNNIREINSRIKIISKSLSNNQLISYAIPIFACTLLIIFIIPLFYKTGKTQSELIMSGTLTELVTVFLLIASILILGIGEIINEQVLGTLLGGISVYVLQKGLAGKKDPERGGNSTNTQK